MRAIRLQRWQHEPELVDIPVPEPGPGQVLLEVEGAGLCHSDLHLSEWPAEAVPFELPFTLGHETAGRVAALGPGTDGVREGTRVLVHSRWGCGRCVPCLQGMDNACRCPVTELPGFGGGVGCDGGLAEYMLVPSARYLVPIDDLDPVLAAPLSDAALTPYHAIKRAAHQLQPGRTVVVIGVGGLGHMAVQLLGVLSPVRVVAIDPRAQAREMALAAGADAALDAEGLAPAELREHTGAAGASLVLDFVASDATLALAAGTVAVGGEIAYVGRGGGSLPVAPGRLPFECSVSLPSWGTVPELVEVVALARTGAISVEVERLRLEDAVEGYRRLRQGTIRGRAVVAM
jgi:propanol-preferring alcohol dehydrogenase